MRGDFIAIEGIDGSGKSTLSKMLVNTIKQSGKECEYTFEPTNGEFGNRIRESFTTERLSLEEEYSLFTKDRKEHLEKYILPKLEAGVSIVCDRYYFSTAAYQGARGMDFTTILNEQQDFALKPNILIIIEISVETALRRISSSRGSTNTFETEEYLRKVSSLFSKIDTPYLKRVDGEGSLDEVFAKIIEVWEKYKTAGGEK